MVDVRNPGQKVWVHDKIHGYVRGHITYDDRVQLETGEELDVGDLVLRRREESPVEERDLTKLSDLSDASLLNHIKMRYKSKQIYTEMGPVLIVVNPYQLMEPNPESFESDGPNLSLVAKRMFHGIMQQKQSQSCIVSGDSGAGKTESAKVLLRGFGELSAPEGSSGLHQRIVQASPILESFGNAKTVRNNNSSRFGKWIELFVQSNTGRLTGGRITNYLLEKSRLFNIASGERNFHVFYQLISDEKWCSILGLRHEGYGEYRIFENSCDDGSGDMPTMEELEHAFDVLGVTNMEREQLFRLLGSIVLLAELEFCENEDDQAFILNHDEDVEEVAKTLGVDVDSLSTGLTRKCFISRNECIVTKRNAMQAKSSRDALSKELYGRLFAWVTDRINHAMQDSDTERSNRCNSLCVLDAFGFECFDDNSFEQLCINFCNEKLQFHFNRIMFQEELAFYKSEGIRLEEDESKNASVLSNEGCINLLGHVFKAVDDENKVPGGNDSSLLRKLLARKEKYHHLKDPGFPLHQTCFSIQHYAGNVAYNVTGFLEKNKDELSTDLFDLCKGSRLKFVGDLFSDRHNLIGGNSKSLGIQFKEELFSLSETIFSSTKVHFVRCIKPNSDFTPFKWCGNQVLEQLHYAGLVDGTRVRALGFPCRKLHREFISEYQLLMRSELTEDSFGVSTICRKLLGNGLGEWQVGKTFVFLKQRALEHLDKARHNMLHNLAMKIQAVYRMHMSKKRYMEQRTAFENLRHCTDREQASKLEILDAISNVELIGARARRFDIVHGDEFKKQMEKARKTLEALDDIEEFGLRFSKALETLDAIALEDIISKASEMKTFQSLVERASGIVQFLKSLSGAIESQDLKALKQCVRIEFKEKVKSEHDRRSIRLRLQQFQCALEMSSAFCLQCAIRSWIERTKARMARKELEQALSRLRRAMDERDENAIARAIQGIEDTSFGRHPLAVQAREVNAQIRLAIIGSINQLDAVMKTIQMKFHATGSRDDSSIMSGSSLECADAALGVENENKPPRRPMSCRVDWNMSAIESLDALLKQTSEPPSNMPKTNKNGKETHGDEKKRKKRKSKLIKKMMVPRLILKGHSGGASNKRIRPADLVALQQAIEKLKQHKGAENHPKLEKALELEDKVKKHLTNKKPKGISIFSSSRKPKTVIPTPIDCPSYRTPPSSPSGINAEMTPKATFVLRTIFGRTPPPPPPKSKDACGTPFNYEEQQPLKLEQESLFNTESPPPCQPSRTNRDQDLAFDPIPITWKLLEMPADRRIVRRSLRLPNNILELIDEEDLASTK